MRLSSFTTICVLLGAAIGATAKNSAADYKSLPFDRLVAQSDAIVRIRVLSTRRNPEVPERLTTEYLQAHRGMLLRQARVRVDTAFKGKGIKPDTVFNITFDTGAACPNALYQDGQEMIVFLVRGRSGDYETLNFDNGQKRIQSDADYRHWSAQIQQALGQVSTVWSESPRVGPRGIAGVAGSVGPADQVFPMTAPPVLPSPDPHKKAPNAVKPDGKDAR